MKKLLIVLSAALPFAGCSDFLDPMPNGHYTDRNLLDYPSMIRGFVEKSYDLLPTSYSGGEYVYLDGATDDVVITAQTNAMRRFAVGSGTPASDPFKTYWIRDYKGIMYANKFLDDFLGLNTRYMIDNEQNLRVQRSLQGDAYALRAWYQLDLLRKWGGRGTDGRLLGFPIVTRPVDVFSADAPGSSRGRPTTNAWNGFCATAIRRSTTCPRPTATGWPEMSPSRAPCAGIGSTVWRSRP